MLSPKGIHILGEKTNSQLQESDMRAVIRKHIVLPELWLSQSWPQVVRDFFG